MTFKEELTLRIKAGVPILAIEAPAINDLMQDIVQVCKDNNRSCITWTPTAMQALHIASSFSISVSDFNKAAKPIDLISLLMRIQRELRLPDNPDLLPKESVIVIRFGDEYLNTPAIVSMLATSASCENWASKGFRIILTSPVVKIPAQLDTLVERLDYPFPDEAAILQTLEDTCKMSKKAPWHNKSANLKELAKQMLGLNLHQIKRIIRMALIQFSETSDLKPVVKMLNEKKAEILKSSSALSLLPYERQADPKMIGGFDNLLDFIEQRKVAFHEDAEKQGIEAPRGVVIFGVPGTGKSLMATAICRVLELPGVILNVGALFGGLVGESESKTRTALATVDAFRECVLIVDEADKALSGADQSTTTDSGTSQRVLGAILTWLQEKRNHVFVVFTMNRVNALPVEFTRCGRFDGIFYSDLPCGKERKAILQAHFKMKNCNPCLTDDEMNEIIEATDGFVGAELKAVVDYSMLAAFNVTKKAVPTFKNIMTAIKGIVPLYRFDKEGIDSMRQFCVGRAIPVSSNTET